PIGSVWVGFVQCRDSRCIVDSVVHSQQTPNQILAHLESRHVPVCRRPAVVCPYASLSMGGSCVVPAGLLFGLKFDLAPLCLVEHTSSGCIPLARFDGCIHRSNGYCCSSSYASSCPYCFSSNHSCVYLDQHSLDVRSLASLSVRSHSTVLVPSACYLPAGFCKHR